MTFNTRLLMTAGIAVLCLGGTALAQPKADLDQDGRVSKAEFLAAADKRFIETDINGDALISPEERETHRANHHAKMQQRKFDRLDTNSDGVITRAEFDAMSSQRSERRTKRRDLNQDGQVDQADREAFREKMKERRKDRRKNRAERISPDTNEDGFVSRAEHDAATLAMFERLDQNGDGYLEKGESRKMTMKKHRRH